MPIVWWSLRLALLGYAACAFSIATAQTIPDAGVLQRDSERSLQPPRLSEPVPTKRGDAQPLAETQQGAVTVKQFVIDGANLIPVEELQGVIADSIGKTLTFPELEHVAQRISEHYRKYGWFVRVFLPRQDVTNGIIHIQIIEGYYGGASIQQDGARANGKYVSSVITHRLKEGEPLSAANLERGLLIANDLSGIQATGRLVPGQESGETRLDIHVEDTPFVTGDIGANNFGNKYTGTEQMVGGLALNNLTGRGDQVSLRALVAKDIYSARLQYVLPVGADGWRLITHGSTLGYRLGGRYASLDAKGKAYTAGLTLSYPLIRQSDRNLTIGAGYEYRRYDDDALGAALRRQRVNALSLQFSGDLRDEILGGAINWGAVQLVRGNLNLDRVPADAATDSAGPRTQGDYTKLAFQLNRLQALGAGSGWQVLLGLSGQVADRNLGSSERLSLGGPFGVRAYPINEGMGDEGVIFKFEVQRSLGHGWQAAVFYDLGYIRQHKDIWSGWDGGTNQPNSFHLSGIGAGINWYGTGAASGWVLKASVATPLGSNPVANAQNENNDGSSASSTRFWVNLSKSF
ncbi:ShlB/FhaC/HecB family hemolysin secretion/activation protein [Pusillimonas sp. DMV24BSW_D]|uniref:ShlB/FhaC/HecB family hemolysin secretion/activation protein n=1 Tax=Neopusillimonas aestuarii TaxID=2716226 RepID=UPI00140BB1B8|nr:ShlB/FhaC/HecB family hemolysin secretion/activation protein [Pusillimonas sp. DMV24BSW_D]QIM47685.1 ShlB/FhaC/HecB family hemolysin secretion/activation protein [Pusillimonas sp. DMV24BSW_D]